MFNLEIHKILIVVVVFVSCFALNAQSELKKEDIIFDYKTGAKENGFYIHRDSSKKFNLPHQKNTLKGYYIVTDYFSDRLNADLEVKRYFNFGFPDTEILACQSPNLYFIYVYFTVNRSEALEKIREVKLTGVPHPWIQIIE